MTRPGDTDRPDLLFLTQRMPYPPFKGEKIRQLRILQYLAQWYDIHFGCLADDPGDLQYIDKIKEFCKDVYVAPLNRRIARIACARGLVTGQPLSVTYFRDRGLARWVDRVMHEVCPSVIFIGSSNMAPYVLDKASAALRVVDLVDVDSEKWRAYAATARVPMQFVYRREWRRVADLERRIAAECDLCTFVSDAEASLFASQVPEFAHRILGVSNGVDQGYFDPDATYEPLYDTTRANFVFTGTMDYSPNCDAVCWFANDIFPRIVRALPDAQFHIVGSSPNDAVQRLARINGIHVTGRVQDVRPYLAHATAAVAPMRIARGIQNKVLEAMALARPVIVTSGALEGIDAEPDRDLIVADTPEAFSEAAIRVARGNDGKSLGAAARRLVIDRYDWNACLSRYDSVLGPDSVPQARRRPGGPGRSQDKATPVRHSVFQG